MLHKYRFIVSRTAKSYLPPAVTYHTEGDELWCEKDCTPKELVSFRKSFQELMLTGESAACVAVQSHVRAIFFDMDATVIREETLSEVANLWGKGAEVSAITERAMRGELDFATSLKQRLQLLKGMPYEKFLALRDALTLNPGIKNLVKAAKQRGAELFLVSGGFVDYAEKVAGELGFTDYFANTIAVANGVLTGDVVGVLVDAREKQRFVQETCARRGFALNEAAAVGDGANDRLMMQGVGWALGFQPKAALIPALHGASFTGSHDFFLKCLPGLAPSAP